MHIIDAQLHDPAPWLEWGDESQEVRDRLLTELTLAWIDSLGITGAVLFSGHGGWADEAAKRLPHRFASVPHVHATETEDWDEFVLEAKAHPGILGLRSVIGWPLSGEEAERAREGGWDPMFAACEKHGMPVFMFATRFLSVAATVAERFPKLTLVVDHLGLSQPPLDQAESPPFKHLADVLDLARFDNVAIKLCGLPGLSAEPFPYRDVRPYLRQFIDAFGVERLMWASDISRFYGRIGFEGRFPQAQVPYPGKHTYAESLGFVKDNDELSDAEKNWILGETVTKLLGWTPTGPTIE